MDSSPLHLTPAQIREFDRLAIEELHIPGIVLMENAGRNAAEVIDRWMNERKVSAAIIVCGVGNNGGDGFVIGRHLYNRGRTVRFCVAGSAERMTPDCRTNYNIAAAMQLPIDIINADDAKDGFLKEMNTETVVVDALLGTGFTGPVREPIHSVINSINAGNKSGVIAVDVPSGLNAETGLVENDAIVADLTVTFVACKTGFRLAAAHRFLGRVVVVGIGAPMSLVDQIIRGSKAT